MQHQRVGVSPTPTDVYRREPPDPLKQPEPVRLNRLRSELQSIRYYPQPPLFATNNGLAILLAIGVGPKQSDEFSSNG